ncbi:MAG: DUF2206 domain-containing protein [Methanobacterium sp.]|uniref:DUF2206 domain-containing protein n=1 Tax=Methanobacterium sp. TaxID=2164 RepID=UPI003D64AD5E|nr:DUF2206 domain-containing protein [Methanobacterium sp.]
MFNHSRSKVLSFIIILMLLTDMVILLDVPFLRQILAFLFFTIVPGMLILQVLKIDISNILKKMALSVGISVSLLMFLGLLLNSLYPYLLKPLSIFPLLISLNLIVVILALAAYRMNKKGLVIGKINLNLDLKGKLTSVIIFPIIFPFMAVFGTYLMNTQGNNIILLLLLFLILIYVVVTIYLRDRISNLTYPFALWMIGLTILLIHGLSSYHLMGRDVHIEYFSFQLTLQNFHWDLSSYNSLYNACISITILPTIYQVLLNFNAEYIFKLVFALIGSIIPVITYFVFKKFIGRTYAFYASLFFIFQIFFIFLLGAVRQEFGFIFFFLAVMVYFDTEINRNAKKILFLIFMFSVLISHYTTAYIAFTLMILILFSPFIESLLLKRKITFVNFDLILIILIFTVIWYTFAAHVQLAVGIDSVRDVVNSVIHPAPSAPSAAPSAPSAPSVGGTPGTGQEGSSLLLAVFGIGLKSTANWISVIVNDLTFALIGIGLITITWKFKYYIKKIGLQYIVGIYASIVILAAVAILPFASQIYGAERLFIQILIFLAPVFIIGVNSIAKLIKRPNANHVMILAVLISLFICTTNLHAHFLGEPYSPYFENDGGARNEYYIYDQEIIAVKWLDTYRINGIHINMDYIGGSRSLSGFGTKSPFSSSNFLTTNETPQGYLYLGYVNVNKNVMYKNPDELRNINKKYIDAIINIKNYVHLFNNKNKIYDSRYAVIYYS